MEPYRVVEVAYKSRKMLSLIVSTFVYQIIWPCILLEIVTDTHIGLLMFESKQISMNILIGLRSTYTTSSFIILHHPSSSIIIIVFSGYPLSTALEYLGSIAESHHKRKIWLPSPRRHIVESHLNMLRNRIGLTSQQHWRRLNFLSRW